MQVPCGLPEHVTRLARGEGLGPSKPGGCYIKPLPDRLQDAAAQAAAEINSANAAAAADSHPAGASLNPIAARLASLMAPPRRFWASSEPRALSVGFLEPVEQDLQRRILQHMNAWNCSISFVQAPDTSVQQPPAANTSDIRITMEPEPSGAASCFAYLGTDALLVPKHLPNMSLVGVTSATPEPELRRVVCHVTGHLLGFHHSPLPPGVLQDVDANEAYIWFRSTQGWNPAMVDQQLLHPHPKATAAAPPSSGMSLMSFWLPAGIMRSGKEVFGASSITAGDVSMCQAHYPVAKH